MVDHGRDRFGSTKFEMCFSLATVSILARPRTVPG
jgi:hypothetical protein